MKTKKFLIGIVALLILSGAGYYYSTVTVEFKESCVLFFNRHLLGKSNEIVQLKVPVEVYAIADGTGSRYINYAIPELNTGFIENILENMYNHDGGKFWLSYIDRDSKNNQVLYINVKPRLGTEKPKRKNGETSFAYSSRLKDWKNNLEVFRKDSASHFNDYTTKMNLFIKEAEILLKKVYTKGTSDNQWTDAIGSINSAVATLSQSDIENSKKYIVCFSDMEQDAPYLNPAPVLNEIPNSINVLAVNPMQGSSKKITESILEIEHTDRLYEILFNN